MGTTGQLVMTYFAARDSTYSASKTRLSIVVPSLNQGEFIGETLSSLFKQRGVSPGELEIIVIDGGSSDGTLDILKRFDGRLSHWVSEPDQGQTDALQKGFGIASGDILGWLCADDLLTPDTVREVLDFFASNAHIGFVYGDAVWINRAGQPTQLKREIPFNWFVWLHDHNYIPQPAAFWRRELYTAVGGLDSKFDLAMDMDLFARFALRQRPRHLRRVWAFIRRYPEQKNQRLRERSDREDRLIRGWLGVRRGNRAVAAAGFLAAKVLRVVWKLLLGGYAPPAVVRRVWARTLQQRS